MTLLLVPDLKRKCTDKVVAATKEVVASAATEIALIVLKEVVALVATVIVVGSEVDQVMVEDKEVVLKFLVLPKDNKAKFSQIILDSRQQGKLIRYTFTILNTEFLILLRIEGLLSDQLSTKLKLFTLS